MNKAFTRKLGPLPVWAWLAVLAGALFYYRRYVGRGASAVGSSSGSVTAQDLLAAYASGRDAAGGGGGDSGLAPLSPLTDSAPLPAVDRSLSPGPSASPPPVIFDPPTGSYDPTAPTTPTGTTTAEIPVSTSTGPTPGPGGASPPPVLVPRGPAPEGPPVGRNIPHPLAGPAPEGPPVGRNIPHPLAGPAPEGPRVGRSVPHAPNPATATVLVGRSVQHGAAAIQTAVAARSVVSGAGAGAGVGVGAVAARIAALTQPTRPLHTTGRNEPRVAAEHAPPTHAPARAPVAPPPPAVAPAPPSPAPPAAPSRPRSPAVGFATAIGAPTVHVGSPVFSPGFGNPSIVAPPLPTRRVAPPPRSPYHPPRRLG